MLRSPWHEAPPQRPYPATRRLWSWGGMDTKLPSTARTASYVSSNERGCPLSTRHNSGTPSSEEPSASIRRPQGPFFRLLSCGRTWHWQGERELRSWRERRQHLIKV